MSEKIEVCGKMVKIGNVYKVTDGGSAWHFVTMAKDCCFNSKWAKWGSLDEIAYIEPINGEVLEDAPFKPVEGQWCVFGDRTVRRFVDIKGDLYCDEYGFKWNMCKPVSPELAAILKKEIG